MRVRGDNAPPGAYSMEPQPGKPGYVCVRLWEHARQVTEEQHWEYDEYQMIVPERAGLQADIEAHIDEWIATARSMEIPENATAVANMQGQIDHMNTVGAAAIQAQASTDPDTDIGVFTYDEWQPDTAYKQGTPFTYNGVCGFCRQDVKSLAIYPPFSVGTEALYGARPAPDIDGVYLYVYNMKAVEGMKVREDEATYYCYNPVDPMLNPPSELAAHFKLAE